MRLKGEMIERVARALNRSKRNAESYPVGWVDRHVDENWHLFIDDARTAIEAMREPTDMMVQRGAEANDKYATEIAPCSGFRSIDSWRAMIDEALK